MIIRQPCPPGACVCDREQLLETPGADQRILQLTRQEEKKLLDRLEDLKSLQDLERMQQLMYQQLGIRVHIAPGHTEVKTLQKHYFQPSASKLATTIASKVVARRNIEH